MSGVRDLILALTSWRIRVNVEIGPADPEPPMSSGTDALVERADDAYMPPLGFAPGAKGRP